MRSPALWRAAGLVVLLAVAAVIPLAKNVTVTHVGVFVLLYVGSAVAWNIFSGFTGYISLGAAVFFGTGVYTVALISKHLNLVGGVVFALYPLAGLMAAVVAVPFGLIALRVRRHTFVVVTIAVFFIFQLMASNFSWTGAATGIFPPFLNWDPATFDIPFYYTALIIAVGRGGARVGDLGLAVRPPAPGDPRRRGPGPRARGQDHAGQADRVRDLRLHRRDAGRAVLLLPVGGAAAVRVQPVLRPDHRPDGVPRRVRHPVRAHLRCAAARALPRLRPVPGVQRVRGRGRPRRAVPGGDHLAAAGDPADGGREADRPAGRPATAGGAAGNRPAARAARGRGRPGAAAGARSAS